MVVDWGNVVVVVVVVVWCNHNHFVPACLSIWREAERFL
jgi:hypothetical protein